MIEREIVCDHFCRRAVEKNPALPLLHIHALWADRPDETLAAFLPMKHLTGVEGARQIKIIRDNVRQPHEILSPRLTRIDTDWAEGGFSLDENLCFIRVHPWLNHPFHGFAPRHRSGAELLNHRR